MNDAMKEDEGKQLASTPAVRIRWLNRTVLGIGLASLFSDCSQEIATTVMPAFLATMGVAAFWVAAVSSTSLSSSRLMPAAA